MKTQSVGQIIKSGAFFAVGARLANAAIDKGKEKYKQFKRTKAAQKQDDEDEKIKQKLDQD